MRPVVAEVEGGSLAGPSSATRCPGCNVQTFHRLCHFCRKTVALIRAGRCVSCQEMVQSVDFQKAQGKCGECLSRNKRLSFATRRLLHLAANARYYAAKAA